EEPNVRLTPRVRAAAAPKTNSIPYSIRPHHPGVLAMAKVNPAKPAQAKSPVATAAPPTIDAVGIVLNTSTVMTNNRRTTSRFHIRGSNFDPTAIVTLNDPNNDWEVHERVHDSTLITVRVKFVREKIHFLQTGEVTVTVTNGDGQQVTSSPVTAAFVTE